MTDSVEHHLSKDGSSTLFSTHFNQFYHNPNGAIAESLHVYFEAPGLLKTLDSSPESLSIFETGFGTGLNLLLFINEYLKRELSTSVHFYSVEAFPVSSETASEINYSEILGNNKLAEIQTQIFSALKPGWNTFDLLGNDSVTFHLFVGFFSELDKNGFKADFFFHDPFSPEVNDELWSVETFMKLTSFAQDNAVLSTYCAASKARAAIAKAGWFVARAPGALGKREMTVASLSEDKLHHLKRVNEKRLIKRLEDNDFK